MRRQNAASFGSDIDKLRPAVQKAVPGGVYIGVFPICRYFLCFSMGLIM